MHLRPQNIRVNTAHPTAVRTMMAVNLAMVSFRRTIPMVDRHSENPPPVDMLEPGGCRRDRSTWSATTRSTTGGDLPVDAGFCNKP